MTVISKSLRSSIPHSKLTSGVLLALALCAGVAVVAPAPVYAVGNTVTTVLNAGTELTSGTSYLSGVAPTNANDIVFSGTSTFSPTTFTTSAGLAAGSLNDANSTALTIEGPASGATAETITLNPQVGGTDSFSGTGTDAIYVAGGSTLTFANSTGTLSLAIASASATIDVNGTLTLSNANGVGDTTFNKIGTGIVIVTSLSTVATNFGNVTNIENGELQLNTAGQIGSTNGAILTLGSVGAGTSGTLALGLGSTGITETMKSLAGNAGSAIIGNASSVSTLALNGAGSIVTYSGVFGGSGGSNQNNVGFSLGAASTYTLAGVNTQVGTTTISSGTIKIASNGTATLSGATAGVTFSPQNGAVAALDLGGTTQTVGALTFTAGSGTSNANLQDGTLDASSITLNNPGSSGVSTYTLSANLGNNGATSLTDSNSGISILSGSNTFSGGVTFGGGGTLLIGSTNALGSGNFTISNAGDRLDNQTGAALTELTNNTASISTSFAFLGSNALNLGKGIVTLSNSITVTTSGSAPLTLGPIGGPTADTFTKAGPGTLVFGGTNGSVAVISVLSGTLQVNNNLGGAYAAGAPLVLSGGVFLLSGSSTGVTSQTVNSGTFNGLAASVIEVDATNSTSTKLAVTALTGTTGNALDILTLNGGTVTTSASNVAGILGGRIVLNGTSFASGNGAGNAITADTTTPFNPTAGTDTNNSVQTDGTTLTGSRTTNSLQILDTMTSQTLEIGAGNTLTLASGGLLFNGTNAYTIDGGTLSSSGTDLVVNQYSPGALTISSAISGAGLTKTGTGTLILAGTNSYSVGTFIDQGTVQMTSGSMALGGTANQLTIAPGATLDTNGSTFTVGLISGSGTLDNTSGTATNITLGAGGGSGGGTAGAVSLQNTGGAGYNIVKTGIGTETLFTGNAAAVDSVTFTPANLATNAGILDLQVNASGGNATPAPVTFNGSGDFKVDNTLAAAATSNTFGAITVNAGEGLVQGGQFTSKTGVLTFASVSRAVGSAINFQGPPAGTNGATNGIRIANLSAGLIGQGIFFGGGDFAYYDSTGFVRAPVYGTDPGFVAAITQTLNEGSLAGSGSNYELKSGALTTTTANGGTTASTTLTVANGANFAVGSGISGAGISVNTYVTGVAGNILTLSQPATVANSAVITPYGSISAQATASINTLNLSANAVGLTLASSGTLTLASGGILDQGNNTVAASVISGGAGIQAATNQELVVRVDNSNSRLIIATPILANGSNVLSKVGAGTLTLLGAQNYTGTTYNTSGYTSGAFSALGTLQLGDGVAAGDVTLASSNIVNNSVLLFAVGSSQTYSGNITGAGSIGFGGLNPSNTNANTLAAGTILTLNGTDNSQTFVNGSQLLSGTLQLGSAASLPQGTLTINAAGALSLRSDSVIDLSSAQNINAGVAAGAFIVNVDQAVSGTGSGLTDKIANFGSMVAGSTFFVTGGHEYGLTTGTITFGSSSSVSTQTITNSAPGLLTLAGVVGSQSASTGILQLNGTAGNILVNGNIVTNSGSQNQTLLKSGSGAVTLQGGASTFLSTTINAGTLIVAANSTASGAGVLGINAPGVTLGDATTTTNNASPTLLTGSAVSIANAITISNQATTGTYTLGGNVDASSTFAGLVTTGSSFTVAQVANTGTNSLTFADGITGANATAKTVNFNNAGNVLLTGSGISNGATGSTLSLLKTGTGVLTLSASSTFTGATNITNGRVVLSTTNALAGTSGITVGSGGTLLLATTNAVKTNANGTAQIGAATSLGGGTVIRNGTSVTEGSGAQVVNGGTPTGTNAAALGVLTLTANSTLDFGTTGKGDLVFNGYVDNGKTLNILDYTNTDFSGGTTTGVNTAASNSGVEGTDDRLIFNVTGGLSSAQLADITFNGATGATEVNLGGNFYEVGVSSVPEPSTVFAGLLLAGLLGFRERKRVASLRRLFSAKKA